MHKPLTIMQVLDGQIPKLTILPYFDYLCVHP